MKDLSIIHFYGLLYVDLYLRVMKSSVPIQVCTIERDWYKIINKIFFFFFPKVWELIFRLVLWRSLGWGSQLKWRYLRTLSVEQATTVVLKRAFIVKKSLVFVICGIPSNLYFYRNNKLLKNYLAILLEPLCENT